MTWIGLTLRTPCSTEKKATRGPLSLYTATRRRCLHYQGGHGAVRVCHVCQKTRLPAIPARPGNQGMATRGGNSMRFLKLFVLSVVPFCVLGCSDSDRGGVTEGLPDAESAGDAGRADDHHGGPLLRRAAAVGVRRGLRPSQARQGATDDSAKRQRRITVPIAEQTQQRDLAPCEDTANLASQRPNSVLPQEAIRKLRPAPGLRWVLHHNAPTHRRAGLTPVTIARPQLEDITQMGDGVRKNLRGGNFRYRDEGSTGRLLPTFSKMCIRPFFQP